MAVVVANIREVDEFEDERLAPREIEPGNRSEAETSSSSTPPLKGEFTVSQLRQKYWTTRHMYRKRRASSFHFSSFHDLCNSNHMPFSAMQTMH